MPTRCIGNRLLAAGLSPVVAASRRFGADLNWVGAERRTGRDVGLRFSGPRPQASSVHRLNYKA